MRGLRRPCRVKARLQGFQGLEDDVGWMQAVKHGREKTTPEPLEYPTWINPQHKKSTASVGGVRLIDNQLYYRWDLEIGF